MLIALVTGGRTYAKSDVVWDALDKLQPDLVVQGGATGADLWARRWASRRVIPCVTMEAPWSGAVNRAGPIRNGWMLDIMKPSVVLAFPGGTGTADMVRRAEEAGVDVQRIGYGTC